jgi:hypothetical protein
MQTLKESLALAGMVLVIGVVVGAVCAVSAHFDENRNSLALGEPGHDHRDGDLRRDTVGDGMQSSIMERTLWAPKSTELVRVFRIYS